MSLLLKTPAMPVVSIVGGGLVGSLAAVYMGRRGYEVHVYEARPDIRTDTNYEGRSINLALSRRGIASLEKIGWDQKIIEENGIPMKGRLVHSLAGDLTHIPYGLHGECILSVDRRKLNADLLTMAEKANINLHFDHKCQSIDFDKKEITFTLPGGKQKVVKTDLVIGADGAHSAVRKLLMRKVRMNYSQEYIGHGYKELTIRPTPEGQYRMSHENLHIWPRQTFMMIALPNKDKSFTCTLFMPFEKFDEIQTSEQTMAFFEKEFPDAIPIMGQENLLNDYAKNPVGPLMSVKCTPYHHEDFCVILGDAAHAMVPFYGQGMNCGFQDVLILDKLVDKYGTLTKEALQEYSVTRNPDAEAICDLAIYNYQEMRSSVSSPLFRFRHQVEYFLGKLFPSKFIPLYTMVAFTEIPYSEVKRRWKSQTKTLNIATGLILGSSLLAAGVAALSRAKTLDLPSIKIPEFWK